MEAYRLFNADSVNTYSGLRDYAENLLRGDD